MGGGWGGEGTGRRAAITCRGITIERTFFYPVIMFFKCRFCFVYGEYGPASISRHLFFQWLSLIVGPSEHVMPWRMPTQFVILLWLSRLDLHQAAVLRPSQPKLACRASKRTC